MCTQGDQKVAQPEVLHLLLARNECDKVTVSTGHVSWHHLSSGFNLCIYQHMFFTNAACFYCWTWSSVSILFEMPGWF